MIAAVPLVFFPFCLIAAALHDARRFRIPNGLSVALILGFGVAAFLAGLSTDQVINHVLTATAMLVFGFGLFCIGETINRIILGPGDTKMLTAVALWFGWPGFMSALVLITFTGGVLCILAFYGRMASRRFPRLSVRSKALSKLAATEQLIVPYGIAIAIGSLLAFRNSPLFDALFAQLG